ncbi:hypothetical protein BGX21_005736, partial [Mortierella sp. AD011]
MSQSPKHTPFTAQVLDALDLNDHNVEQNKTKIAQEQPVIVQPPSFDSFPDLAIPTPPVPAGPSGWSVPSFSSFPTDSSLTRKLAPSEYLADTPIEDKPGDHSKSKEKKKSKKDDRTRSRQHHDESQSGSQKKRPSDNQNDDYREKRKEKRERSRSKSRDRSSRSHRSERDYRGQDRSETKDRSKFSSSSNSSKRRENSRDRHHHSRSGHRDDRDTRRDDRRISSHSSRHDSRRTQDDNRSPDRKRSRHDETNKDESWSSRRDRDRDRDLEMKSLMSGKLQSSSSQWGSKTDEKHKPGTWIIDVKGDRDAFRYGGLDPLTVPRYNRAGDVRIGNKSKPADDSDSEDPESNSEEDKATGKKKIDYRDIHGKSVYKEDDEDLLQTTSDQEEEGAESAFDVLMRRRMMLDGELRKDPRQPEKCLEFIAVEDDIDL